MPLISVSNLTKSFGARVLLDGVSFHINERERVALIGDNGSGKTTLLKIILGEEEPDSGSVNRDSTVRIGYLPQEVDLPDTAQMLYAVMGITPELLDLAIQIREIETYINDSGNMPDELLSARYSELSHTFDTFRGFDLQIEAQVILKGLGFNESDLYKPIQELSGGQKTRAALARLLLLSPDILLLDEPTNHLDISAREWLQSYLRERYAGAAIIVSHDRYFLDHIVTRVIEIEDQTTYCYNGNYSQFAEKKRAVTEERLKSYMLQQKEIARLEKAIQTLFSDRKFKRRDSKEKQLDRIKKTAPVHSQKTISANFASAARTGRDVLKIRELSMSYPGKTLFRGLNLIIERGKKIGIVGPNGSGKTTLLKILSGQVDADEGSFTFGLNVEPTYFAQEFDHLVPNRTVLEELLDDADITTAEARDLLAKFLFIGNDAFKQVHTLSGGEMCRLALAKIIAGSPNLLLLDEPTNHLDIRSRESLERALRTYDGTILVASHDRYLLDAICTDILEIKDGKWKSFAGNYTEYLERTTTGDFTPLNNVPHKNTARLGTAKRPDSPLKSCQRQLRGLEKKRRELEIEIEESEKRSAELGIILSQPHIWSDPSSRQISDEHTCLCSRLDELYREWESVSIEIENLTSQIASLSA